jgi:hypothetical protein
MSRAYVGWLNRIHRSALEASARSELETPRNEIRLRMVSSLKGTTSASGIVLS